MKLLATYTGAAIIAGFAFIASAASVSAMPVSKPAEATGPGGIVHKVLDGCGRGWVRDRWGDCIPVRRAYRPPVYVAPQPRYYYAPGYHYGPRYHPRPRYDYGPRYRYGHGHRYRDWD